MVINIIQSSMEPECIISTALDMNDDHSSKTDSLSLDIDAGDAWGFDDDIEEPEEPQMPKQKSLEETEPDLNEAWGWNDELAEEQPQGSIKITPQEPTKEDKV